MIDARVADVTDLKTVDTFESVLERKYQGMVDRFGKVHKLTAHQRGTLRELLRGGRSVDISRSVMKKVARVLRMTLQQCFPPERYRAKMFSGIRDTPGFQFLQTKFGIAFHSHKNSFEYLLKEKGLSLTEVLRLRNVMLGNFSVRSSAKFCREISARLGVGVENLFPSEVYGPIDDSAVQESGNDE